MAKFNLDHYLGRFGEICRKKFGRAYSFESLGKEFEQVRTGGRGLKTQDVARLFNPNWTPFNKYWPRPDQKELDHALRQKPLYWVPIPDDGRTLVERLLGVLHSLGLVSLVLRFVHPDRFGIFSTPVVNLLQIHRANTVDLYLAFCKELRAWKEHFGMASVAETEMALWTYDQLATGRGGLGEDHEARRLFEQDLWIQRQRVGQALTPLLDKYGPLELASILANQHPKLAGMIAGAEFERLMRLKAKKFYGRRKRDRKTDVPSLIDEFARHGQLTWAEARELHEAWRGRDKAVHPKSISPEEVEVVIGAVGRVCLPWEK